MCTSIQFGFADPGNWVLLEGLDATITKTATLVPESLDEEVHIIRPLQFYTQVTCRGPRWRLCVYLYAHTQKILCITEPPSCSCCRRATL